MPEATPQGRYWHRKDAALALGVHVATLDRWRRRRKRRFPKPAWIFGRTPIWVADLVKEWQGGPSGFPVNPPPDGMGRR